MRTRSLPLSLLAPLALLAAASDAAAQAQTWGFDQTTSGQDLSWTSPTAVDPAAAVYASSYVLTRVEVDVQWSFITLNDLDVTGQVPPEQLAGSSTLAGPAPVALLDLPVVAPSPPEPPAVSALLSMGLDASGHGYMTATNVDLGTMQVDLGFPFGVQTVTILSVRIVGQLTMHAAWFDLGAALAGTHGAPALSGDGMLQPGSAVTLALSNALENSSFTLVLGVSALNAPFKGGTLVPFPTLLIFGLPTGPAGALALAGTWPPGLPSNIGLYFQEWIADPAGPSGLSATNAVKALTP
ncbi:MAG TPA: hypothetical protein VFD43_01750 [Planctomycetota bacterium]|nr:hypothetical protein [Planctomycetota bacterium]